MTPARWIPAAMAAGCLLAGCSASAPLHYYTLEAVTPLPAATAQTTAMLIQVRHISVPAEMDHRGLTHTQGATQLLISDSDEWSASLTTLIQGALSRDLGERLGYAHVVAPTAQPVVAPPNPDRRGMHAETPVALDLDFLTLVADAGCGVDAQVNWTLSGANVVIRRGSVHLSAPATTCPAGLPQALSAALGSLADQLLPQLTTP